MPDLRCTGVAGFPGDLKQLPAPQITDSGWKPWLAGEAFPGCPLPAPSHGSNRRDQPGQNKT